MAHKESLIFAPIIRVSGIAQKKRGESLRTQRKQLEEAISSLGGTVYRWYEGQEHATPEQERKILDQVIEDSKANKFHAVNVCDTSRWSRDNQRSKGDLEIFKKNGIRFFVLTKEFDLFNPLEYFIVSMNVEIAEFFASEQSYKSLINCMERARRGIPTKGRLPYGRTFNTKTGEWGIDPEKKQKIEYAVHDYLNGASMRDLAKYLGICCSQVHHTFAKRLGADWEIRFRSARLNIDENVPIKIPPLVSEENIDKVKARLEVNKTCKHGQLKNQYLLGRMIFCRQCGYALVGAEYHGHLYYRHQAYRRCSAFGSIRADIIDNPVFNDIFEVVGDVTRIRESIERALPDLEKQKLLSKQFDICRGDLLKLETQQRRLIDSISNGIIENEEASEKISEIREKNLILKQTMDKISVELDSMPSQEEVNMSSQLLHSQWESFWQSTGHKEKMTVEDKRKVLQELFSEKTSDGRRSGVYVEYHRHNKKGPWHYQIEGSFIDLSGRLGVANLDLVSKNNPGNCTDSRYHCP